MTAQGKDPDQTVTAGAEVAAEAVQGQQGRADQGPDPTLVTGHPHASPAQAPGPDHALGQGHAHIQDHPVNHTPNRHTGLAQDPQENPIQDHLENPSPGQPLVHAHVPNLVPNPSHPLRRRGQNHQLVPNPSPDQNPLRKRRPQNQNRMELISFTKASIQAHCLGSTSCKIVQYLM